MISALSRIDPERLRVTAGSRLESSNASAGHVDRLQRQLDLDYLLRGSVRRSVEKVRISAQLHDLRDKSVLWSETYERKSADLLAVQEEVAQRVSRSLALVASENAPSRVLRSASFSKAEPFPSGRSSPPARRMQARNLDQAIMLR